MVNEWTIFFEDMHFGKAKRIDEFEKDGRMFLRIHLKPSLALKDAYDIKETDLDPAEGTIVTEIEKQYAAVSNDTVMRKFFICNFLGKPMNLINHLNQEFLVSSETYKKKCYSLMKALAHLSHTVERIGTTPQVMQKVLMDNLKEWSKVIKEKEEKKGEQPSLV